MVNWRNYLKINDLKIGDLLESPYYASLSVIRIDSKKIKVKSATGRKYFMKENQLVNFCVYKYKKTPLYKTLKGATR